MKFISFLTAFIMCFLSLFGTDAVKSYKVASPKGFGKFTESEAELINDADFYVSVDGKIGGISDAADKFSTVENIAIYRMTRLNKIFTDPDNGDYSLKENSAVYKVLPEFENIPVNEIGRY